MTQITDHLANIERRVAEAAARAGRRPECVHLLAVSKAQTTDAIIEAYDAGQRRFAENYLQEAIDKVSVLSDRDIEWHYIGRIQSNKTRLIAENFDWVQTVDRPRIAERLNAARPHYARPLNVLIQLNLESEAQKSGVKEHEVSSLVELVDSLPRLNLRGLMSIPPLHFERDELARHFGRVSALAGELSASGLTMDWISMGMSNDFELAIEHGSTCVRIGTAIFGPRDRQPA